jgi:alkylresorcinol/alkylpyrone synthase
MSLPRLVSIATATPPHVLMQDLVAARAAEVFKGKVFRTPDLLSIFENTGIKTRKAVRPMPWYAEHHGWAERNAVYLDGAQALYVEVAKKALDAAGLDARDVGAVVTVSSSGISTPSLEARVFDQVGFDPEVRRTPVFGLGCAGGAAGFALAARLARAEPDKPVLLVVVELSTLACRPDEASKENIISTALFGDGAAAAVISAAPGARGRAITATGEHLWTDTLDIMGWRIDPLGFGVILANYVPAFVSKNLAEVAGRFLHKAGLEFDQVGRFVCHPGGAKVVPAIEEALKLAPGSLDIERDTLRDYGNMSAPTVLFILKAALERGVDGPAVMSAMGPGFTAQFIALSADEGPA